MTSKIKTMGGFSEELLQKFNQMFAAGLSFNETNSYDFVRCIMPDGEIYGTKHQCKVGKPLAEEDKESKGGSDSRLAYLKKAFMKKIGREMTAQEIAKARNMLGVGVPIPKGKSAEDVLQELLPKGEKVVPVKAA